MIGAAVMVGRIATGEIDEPTPRALRQLASNVPVEAIVADLSAGFWVSLLNSGYEVPFVWRHNLGRVCPNEPHASQKEISDLSNELLGFRNRVAHHELTICPLIFAAPRSAEQ